MGPEVPVWAVFAWKLAKEKGLLRTLGGEKWTQRLPTSILSWRKWPPFPLLYKDIFENICSCAFRPRALRKTVVTECEAFQSQSARLRNFFVLFSLFSSCLWFKARALLFCKFNDCQVVQVVSSCYLVVLRSVISLIMCLQSNFTFVSSLLPHVECMLQLQNPPCHFYNLHCEKSFQIQPKCDLLTVVPRHCLTTHANPYVCHSQLWTFWPAVMLCYWRWMIERAFAVLLVYFNLVCVCVRV